MAYVKNESSHYSVLRVHVANLDIVQSWSQMICLKFSKFDLVSLNFFVVFKQYLLEGLKVIHFKIKRNERQFFF